MRSLSEGKMQLGDWTVEKELSSGAFSRVYLVSNPMTKEEAAAKIFDKKVRALPSSFKKEADLLASLSHPGLVKFKSFQELMKLTSPDGKYRYETVLFTEYASEGDFHSFLEEFAPFPEDLARTYFKQIIQVVEYLHNNDVCHRDLKPENFVLTSNFALKLCDFGSAASFKEDGKFQGFIGTDTYLAPEFRSKKPFGGEKMDIFACGIMLFAMLLGYRPFGLATPEDGYYSLLMKASPADFWDKHEKSTKASKNLKFLSKEVKDLIVRMLASDPEERLSLSEIKRHSWYQGLDVKETELKQRLHEISIEKFEAMSFSIGVN